MHMIDPTTEADLLAFHSGVERARLVPADPDDAKSPLIRRIVHQRPRITRDAVKNELSTDLTEALMQGVI